MQYINTDAIREETRFGEDYLVAPVRAMKSMVLHRGYVPAAEIERSAPAWNGTPVTLNHPTAPDGALVSAANSPDVADATWLGHLFNAETTTTDDGATALDGEVWVRLDHANRLGGEAAALVDRLEAGDDIAVSSAYFGDPLEPGEYDGDHHDAVVGNLRPDHLALLPNTDGKCSLDDGCKAGQAAPVAVANADSPADGLSITAPHAGAQAPHAAESTDSDTDPTDSTSCGCATEEPSVNMTNPPDDSTSGLDPDQFGAQAGASFSNKVRAMLGLNADTPLSRDERIAALVANHGFKRESLDAMGDACLERTYTKFAANDEAAEGDGEAKEAEAADAADAPDADDAPDEEAADAADAPDEEAADADDDTTDTDSDEITMSVYDFEARVAQAATEAVEAALATNEQATRAADLVSTIKANDAADEYNAEELAETPLPVLETIAADVTETAPVANYAAQRAAPAQATSDASDDFPSLAVNRAADEEGEH